MPDGMPVTGAARSAPADQAAELVVRNGRIHTGNPMRPAATAMAISGGKIVRVGDEGDVAPLVGKDTQVIDAIRDESSPVSMTRTFT